MLVGDVLDDLGVEQIAVSADRRPCADAFSTARPARFNSLEIVSMQLQNAELTFDE